MNYDSYLARAIEIFNDKMDADFSCDNVMRCITWCCEHPEK